MISKTRVTALLVTVLIAQCQGLHMNVSQKNAMLAMGSNLTISCSDKRPFDMDWLLGRSHLSSCSLRTDHSGCLPGGRFVVRPDNDTFQLNLVNLALQDCGTYTCKTSSSQKTHTVRLIEHVKIAELSETDDAITLTTGCVLPGYTVDIRWFYIHKDEPPHLYDKPTFRLERTEGCSGVCVDNNLVRVSSTLQLPTTLKQPLAVKLMANIQQDGQLWQYTTAQDYAIEGCPPETAETVIKWLLGMVCIFCSLHLVSVIYSECKSKTSRDLSRLQRAFISAVSIVCGIAGIFLQKVIRLPGACDSSNSAAHLVAVVGYVIIAVTTVAIEVLSIWRGITLAGSGTGNQHMTAEIEMNPVKPKQSKEEKKLLGSKKPSDLTVASSYKYPWKKECNLNLSGSVCKYSQNIVEVKVGDQAVLKCDDNITKDYPSWQKPNKELLSLGGKKKFRQTDGRLAWENDKKSISIRDVQSSDAGTYICNLNEGEVQTVDLIVSFPPKTLTYPAKSSFPLVVDERILGPFPQWSRRCIINSSFHDIFNKTDFDWDKDRKSLIVKDFRAKDEGVYEVSSNYCVQRFELRVATEDKESLSDVEAGMKVRLECPDQGEPYPSWHCVKYNIFNVAGSQVFLEPKSSTKPDILRRLEWSTDKRSLLIRDFRPDDSGTFLCRMADGTCLKFGLSFKETQKTDSEENKQETV